MRPIHLSIQGLHSFREKQVIHFDQVSDAGVFGIFGQTGSGKSSILDAMTLALYGTVGRAKGGTQGILNHAEQSLSVSFVFSVGQGADRHLYQVDRRYNRGKASDVSVQNSYSRLIELDADEQPLSVLADKERDVSGQVQAILGLKQEDFTRAVVLPQGKFSEFLQLTGKERRGMLQRIFSLQRYGIGLNTKLNQRHQSVLIHNEQVLGEQKGLGDCSADAVLKAKEILELAQDTEIRFTKELETAQMLHAEAEKKIAWQSELSNVESSLAVQQNLAVEIEQKARRLQMAEKANTLLPIVDRLLKSKQETTSLNGEVQKMQDTIVSLQSNQVQAMVAWQEAHFQKETETPNLYKRKSQLESALPWEQEIIELRKKYNNFEIQKSNLESEMTHVRVRLDHVVGERLQKVALIQEKQGVLDSYKIEPEFRKVVAKASQLAAECQVRRKEVDDVHQELDVLASKFQSIQAEVIAKETKLHSLQKEQATLQSRLQELERSRPLTEDEWVQKQIEMGTLHDRKERLRRLEEQRTSLISECLQLKQAISNLAESDGADGDYETIEQQLMASRVAALLQQGCPCPVCGSIDHPSPSSFEIYNEELQDIYLSISQKSSLLHETNEQVKRIESQMEVLRLEIDGLLTEADFLQLSDQFSAWKKMHQEAQELYKHLEEESRKLSYDYNSLVKDEQRVGQELQNLQFRLQDRERIFHELNSNLEEVLSDTPYSDITELVTEVENKDQAAAQAEQERRLLQTDLDSCATEEASLMTQLSSTQEALHSLQLQSKEHQHLLHIKEQQLNQIAAGQSVETLYSQVSAQIETLLQRERETKEQLDTVQHQIITSELTYTQLTTRLNEAERLLQQTDSELNQLMSKYQFSSIDDIRNSVLPDTEMLAIQEESRKFSDTITRLEQKRIELLDKIDGSQVSDEEWENIKGNLEDAKQNKQYATMTLGAGRVQYQEVQDKHVRWSELEEQRIGLARELTSIQQLRDVLKGDRFVEFIAVEQLDLIAKQASHRLKRLTRDRYALEVADDGGFVMRDDANGSVKRPVSTLSGGETFLTSLALALSLSSQIQLRGKYPLEFFFLDEGFGTLDPDLLDIVMSSLEQLHLENMTIGIISHVPELQQRLQRKIIVKSADETGRGTTIFIEKG